MIDLHSHSLLSDGELLPEELVRRYEAKGYHSVAITDHAGPSNLQRVIETLLEFSQKISSYVSIKIIPGVELTHCPPKMIPTLVKEAREAGAKIVLVHGETPIEPVPPGTNLAAIEAGADILAHPGLITQQEAELAAKRGVCLEISARHGHCLCNGHILKVSKRCGARLVLGSDSHSPDDILPPEMLMNVAKGAGMDEEEVKKMLEDMEDMVRKCLGF